MSLDFNKINSRKHEGDSFWVAYSDLYTMLACVFLLLYVVSSVRSGTAAIQGNAEMKELAAEAADLKEQNRVYNTLKEDYLEQRADPDEQKVYKELMDKLSLLQEEAKDEKVQLRKKASENEAKERALNKYQQIVRNIVDANLLAKSGLKSRDEVIATKKQKIASLGQEIEEQTKTIAEAEATLADQAETLQKQEQVIAKKQKDLQARTKQVEALTQEVESKQATIIENNAAINSMNDELAEKITDLKKTQQQAKTSKAKLKEQIEALQSDTEAKVAALAAENAAAKEQLEATTGALGTAQGKLEGAEKALGDSENEKGRLRAELGATKERLQGEIEGLKAGFADEMGKAEKAFKDGLAKEKLSGKEKAAREKEYAKAAEEKAKALGDQVAGLEGKIKDAEGKLKDAAGEKEKYKNYIAALEKDKGDLAEDLKASQAQLADKKKLAAAVQKAFDQAHIKAKIDPKTGEVAINFDDYFDTGKADLKDGMTAALKKLIPTYANGLFKDPEIASKIAAVEIIGFASPTYKGKYVDPESMAGEDREAVNYNLDLSYQRAKAIFNFAFDKEKMKFDHQKDMLPLLKVTGRSYLHEAVKGRDLKAGVPVKQFCAEYDCEKEQKVIIKFHLKD